ncbi:MAG: putative enzyme with DAC domain protein [Parcubacteria group bacterium Gr01-1014_38]|nr:MAG: putative enzyme with DAC domain protein [Parcubacteria group bacterium Gr01-1014_38]
MLERILNLLQGGIQPPAFLTTGTPARLLAALDILLVAGIFYAAIRFLRRTRAKNILWSLAAILLAIAIARFLSLHTLNAVLTLFAVLLVIALPLLFQPELRRGLERLGRFLPFLGTGAATLEEPVLAAIVEVVETLRARRWGAILVLERRTYLSEYADTGVPIQAEVRSPLLEAIFSPESPLHDGAVITRGQTILAAGCTLPLADHREAPSLGTRHRAAQGITEVSDAVAVVVSEERGTVSVATDGRLTAIRHPPDLKATLRTLLPAAP